VGAQLKCFLPKAHLSADAKARIRDVRFTLRADVPSLSIDVRKVPLADITCDVIVG